MEEAFSEALRAVPIASRGPIRRLWNTYDDKDKQGVVSDLKDAKSKEDREAYLMGLVAPASSAVGQLWIEVDFDVLKAFPSCPLGGVGTKWTRTGKFQKYALHEDGALWVERELGFLSHLRGCRHIVAIQDIRRNMYGKHNFYLEPLEVMDPLGHSKQIARDLLAALKECHAHGIVHGDVKPEHIMWSRRDRVYKLVDFGVARYVGYADQTGDGSLGTPGFMAPEVEMGKLPTKASDMWSAGVTLLDVCYPGLRADSTSKQAAANVLDILLDISHTPRKSVEPSWKASNLIARLLRWHPKHRWTAAQACQWPGWSVRVPSHKANDRDPKRTRHFDDEKKSDEVL